MSSAFVKESEQQWLYEVQPMLPALILYLTGENNGVRIYEKKQTIYVKTNKEVYEMSNGLSYTKDTDGRWEIKW